MGKFTQDGDHFVCVERTAPKSVWEPPRREPLPPLDDMPEAIEEYRNFKAEEQWSG